MMLAVKDAEKKYDTRSLKYCLSSGEPLLAETWRGVNGSDASALESLTAWGKPRPMNSVLPRPGCR
jgi:acyl-coenzyme A synthetase/AMP-(fatty) acid ligase